MHLDKHLGISLIAILLALLCLAGCKAKPQETTVIYAEIVGCYRDPSTHAPNGVSAAYRVDFIWQNDVYQATGARSYYNALNHLYGQAWVRVVLEDGEIKEVKEVLE